MSCFMQPLYNHLISSAHCSPYFICPSRSGLLLINKPCQGDFHLWGFVTFPLCEKSFTPDRGLIYTLIFFKLTLLSPYKRGHPNLTHNIVSSTFYSLLYFPSQHLSLTDFCVIQCSFLDHKLCMRRRFGYSLLYPQCQNQCQEFDEHLLR